MYSDWAVDAIKNIENENRQIKSRSKSTEVRTGAIMERASPFLDIFGENPENIRHLGGEVDYIVFNEDSIVFVEVKTGKSRLSKRQSRIKRLVEEGKVEFKLVRME